jgi:hypothetical protein
LLLILMAMLAFLGQCLLSLGINKVKPSRGTLMNYF